MDKEKDLEKLLDKVFDADQLDAPSFDFTSAVLQKVEAQTKERFSYTPLLPKWVLIAIILLALFFVGYVFNNTDSAGMETNYFESLNLSTSWLTDGFLQFNFSRILGYSILPLGVLICIQASLLSKFVNRTNSLA
ncbi:MAG: hypothetical protein AAF039_12645 [Bacteroidota bacterium]